MNRNQELEVLIKHALGEIILKSTKIKESDLDKRRQELLDLDTLIIKYQSYILEYKQLRVKG